MSKSTMDTRKKILDKALEMFNERGIEYVGLRELAAILGIRVSNITYYFPTKDDLVYALSLELSNENAELIVERDTLTMAIFLEMLQNVFQNHMRFRCLLLSVVHLMKQNKYMSASYKNTQKVRNKTLYSNLQALQRSGYLRPKDETEMDFLVSGISLISRFWISEAAISLNDVSSEQQIRQYLDLISKLLLPYSTPEAHKDINIFFENLS